MYTIDDLLPLSALQHIVFCERQCALIYTEQAWAENRLTVEGRIMHERVHEESRETENTARRAHDLIASGQTPPPVYAKRCESCSLLADCLPKTIQKRRSVKGYLKRILSEP